MATNSSGATPPETFDYEEYQHHLDLVRDPDRVETLL